jgi:hypothetical protein
MRGTSRPCAGRRGEVSAEKVTGFFLIHARERRLTDWEFRQFVDTAQPLLIDLAQAPGSSAAGEDVWEWGEPDLPRFTRPTRRRGGPGMRPGRHSEARPSPNPSPRPIRYRPFGTRKDLINATVQMTV